MIGDRRPRGRQGLALRADKPTGSERSFEDREESLSPTPRRHGMTTTPEDPLVQSQSRAVERSPDSIELHMHLAELLFERGRYTEALTPCSTAAR